MILILKGYIPTPALASDKIMSNGISLCVHCCLEACRQLHAHRMQPVALAHLASVRAEQLCAEREITSSLDTVAIAAAKEKLRGITVHLKWKIQSKAKDAYLQQSNYPVCDMYFHMFIQ